MKKILWGALISCISAAGILLQDSAADGLHDFSAAHRNRKLLQFGESSTVKNYLSEISGSSFQWNSLQSSGFHGTGSDSGLSAELKNAAETSRNISADNIPEINSPHIWIPASVRSQIGAAVIDSSEPWFHEKDSADQRISERGGADSETPDPGFRYMIFLSSSIPELTRLEIYRSLCGRNDAVILYRGLSVEAGFHSARTLNIGQREREQERGYVPGYEASGAENIRSTSGPDLFSRLTEMQREAGAACSQGLNIRIDPRLFRYFNIDAVPFLVTADPDGGFTRYEGAAVLRRVMKPEEPGPGASAPCEGAGSASRGKIRNSPSRYGPVYEIAEMSLTESLASRFSGLDWGKLKREAADRFFERTAGYYLPSRFSCRTENGAPAKRIIDPVMVLRRDLTDHEGRVLYPAGTRVNPLAYRAFRRYVFVFNPAIPEEIRAVEEYRRVRSVPSYMAINIVTEIRGREEWEKLGELRNSLGKIYLLRQDVAERFSLESTPSVIYQEGGDLVLESVPPAAGNFSSRNTHGDGDRRGSTGYVGSRDREEADDELH